MVALMEPITSQSKSPGKLESRTCGIENLEFMGNEQGVEWEQSSE